MILKRFYFFRLGVLNHQIVFVPYIHNKNSYLIDALVFPSWGFIRGFPYPKHYVYIDVIIIDVSQYLLSVALLVKENPVWLSIEIKIYCLALV